MEKYREYGPRVVLCCRGHVFAQHSLNDEEPHRFWEDYEYMKFYDEKEQDRQVIILFSTFILLAHACYKSK